MFACIYIPDFQVEAIIRTESLLRERAVAVLDGKPPVVRVIALNEKARLLGMDAGMTKLQAAVFAANEEPPWAPSEKRQESGFAHIGMSAQQLMNKLPNQPALLRQRSAEQEKSTHGAMLDVAHAFTPRVEDTAPDTLLLDLAGLERLYGLPSKMARELASRVTAVGVEANIAIAANPEAALYAARGFNGVTVIPSGQEAQRLAVLPIQVLLDAFELCQPKKHNWSAADREREKLREQMLDTLERWGVRDFRTLALLPEHALASRLGETGIRLQRLSRGAGSRTLVLCQPATYFEEAMELESPVETLEPLSFLLNRLLEQLCARLEARALAVQELTLRLHLERRVADEETTTVQELHSASPSPLSHNVGYGNLCQRNIRLPVAMRDTKVFLKLLQLDLDNHPPGAPVVKIWIAAEPAPPRSVQRGLFLPVTPEVEKLEITLARISSIVGERRAGIALLLDTHRKDSFRIERFVAAQDDIPSSSSPAVVTMGDVSAAPPIALRIFRPARQLLVIVNNGRPASMATMVNGSDQNELHGQILWAAGPWRSSGDWWTEQARNERVHQKEEVQPWDREEWDIALGNQSGGKVALYRIYRDVSKGLWFADASYD